MKRQALDNLKKWKDNAGRKPLILRGARQVGKTWLLMEFARTNFRNSVYVNFEDAPPLRSLFADDFDIDRS